MSSQSQQKDSRVIPRSTDTIIRYGSGYMRVHVQDKTQKPHTNCTGEKFPDICKNKLEQ